VLQNPVFAPKLDWPMRKRMAIEAAAGIVFLHARGILHLDLKPLNLLVINFPPMFCRGIIMHLGCRVPCCMICYIV
jgi:serine/threonine protein kinase